MGRSWYTVEQKKQNVENSLIHFMLYFKKSLVYYICKQEEDKYIHFYLHINEETLEDSVKKGTGYL